MATGVCPECGSTRINQYRMPYGPIWCMDCGFRVEDKTATPNPFLESGPGQAGGDEPGGAQENETKPKLGLGAAMYELFKSKKRKRDRG